MRTQVEDSLNKRAIASQKGTQTRTSSISGCRLYPGPMYARVPSFPGIGYIRASGKPGCRENPGPRYTRFSGGSGVFICFSKVVGRFPARLKVTNFKTGREPSKTNENNPNTAPHLAAAVARTARRRDSARRHKNRKAAAHSDDTNFSHPVPRLSFRGLKSRAQLAGKW